LQKERNSMKQLSHITLSSLNKLPISPETMLTVSIEEEKHLKKIILAAMKKLRGSGNGKLLKALTTERAKEKNK